MPRQSDRPRLRKRRGGYHPLNTEARARKAEREQRKAATPSMLIERKIALQQYLGGISLSTAHQLEEAGILIAVKLNPLKPNGKTFYSIENIRHVASQGVVRS